MGWYEDRALPWLIDKSLDHERIHDRRKLVCAGLTGTVLEIGFGSGLNADHYPAAVERVLAVDPAEYARSIGAERIARCAVPIEFVGLDGQHLPIEDESVDSALSTFTLCTIPDVDLAIGELWRVMRPGATLHFIEHGLAESTGVQTWQRRIEPAWKRVAGGCHITRQPDALLAAAGFEVECVRHTEPPATHASMFTGTATKPK